MSKNKNITLSLFLSFFIAINALGQGNTLDVKSYTLTLKPDIESQSIRGDLTIVFELDSNQNSIVLQAGDLEVDSIIGEEVVSYKRQNSNLLIKFDLKEGMEHEVSISYHGNPKRGLHFDTTLNQAYTVYFTEHWMICNSSPGDRARFSLNLVLPKGMTSIASGKFLEIQEQKVESIHKWQQDYETPAYTYGFVIGSFNKATEQADDVLLNYYSSTLSESDLLKVFIETPNILKFYEEKTGIEYVQNSYSQILIGKNYQEMSGLSVLSENYHQSVLKDSSEIHLTSHELAHQWWGNMITCENYGHFWLNEAFAVYMSSAFNEYKFGRQKYLSDIAIYKKIYDDLIEKGKDKSLIFEKWVPTRDNRNVIYYKGAYVLHRLREELGDKAFWQGIKSYSTLFYRKSVQTDDFKFAMEKATETNLDAFFNKWVYN